MGRAIRATAQNREAAQLMGVRVGRGLCAGAGAVRRPRRDLRHHGELAVRRCSPNMGGDPMLKAFIICVVAGLGNVYGAVVAALAARPARGDHPICARRALQLRHPAAAGHRRADLAALRPVRSPAGGAAMSAAAAAISSSAWSCSPLAVARAAADPARATSSPRRPCSSSGRSSSRNGTWCSASAASSRWRRWRCSPVGAYATAMLGYYLQVPHVAGHAAGRPGRPCS